MKAEEIFIKCGNECNAMQVKHEEVAAILTDPELAFIFKAMREYAKDQIEKDRERVLEQIYEDDGAELISTSFTKTPIILD